MCEKKKREEEGEKKGGERRRGDHGRGAAISRSVFGGGGGKKGGYSNYNYEIYAVQEREGRKKKEEGKGRKTPSLLHPRAGKATFVREKRRKTKGMLC